jgi:hypothetical protein
MRLQSFHPTRHLPHFYRYVRVDFLSYYGSEYYCPVSLLRVYGLTPMEEWKYDVWVAEWEAMYGGISNTVATPTISGGSIDTVPTLPESSKGVEMDAGVKVSSAHAITPETASEHSTTASNVKTSDSHTPTPPSTANNSSHTQSVPAHTTTEDTHGDPLSQTSSNQPTNDSSQPPVVPTDHPTDFILTDTSNGTIFDSTHTTNGNNPSDGTKILTTKVIATTTSVAVAPTGPGGESVYRMILNRLSNVEGNQTLYARYVEDQARSANDRLRILEEEVGRLGAFVSTFIPLVQRPGVTVCPIGKNTTADLHEIA